MILILRAFEFVGETCMCVYVYVCVCVHVDGGGAGGGYCINFHIHKVYTVYVCNLGFKYVTKFPKG